METAEQLCEEASALIDVDRYDEALKLLGRAVAMEPDNPWPHSLTSQVMLMLDRHVEGLREADAAAHIDPESEWSHRLRAVHLLQLNRRREAVEAAYESVRLQPNLAEALHNLVLCLIANRNKQEAHETALHLVEIAPDRSISHFSLGFAEHELRHWPEAEESYRRALSIDPENWEAMNNLGVVLQRTGRKEEAIARFHDAAKLSPQEELSRKNLKSAIGGYATVGFGLVYFSAQILRLIKNAVGGGDAVYGWGFALLFLGVLVFYFVRSRKRWANLNEEARFFYQAEVRRERRESMANIAAGAVVCLTMLPLVGWTFVMASDSRLEPLGYRIGYAGLWVLFIVELGWIIQKQKRAKQ